ncbi:MAG TPA: choice-of-anchor tandem repeat GloVer-containing protein, partial [Candidatus Dormibacteraeota bacterium]|nr:choice-of-anchor tandem repeat GloVer-containing protein [Candidatus Dormibacteraeota bacterium]
PKRFSLGVAGSIIRVAASFLLALSVVSSVFTVAAQPANPQVATFELPTPVRVLYSFTAATNYVPFFGYTNSEGASCAAALIQGNGGRLYGVAPSGGAFGSGTVFSLNTNGSDLTVLHTFSALSWRLGASNDDGCNPSGLILGIDGKLYGTASAGGANGFGAIFKLDTDGNSFTNLHSFGAGDGENPHGGLVQGPEGTLYGTAQNGGTNGSGTVFRMGSDGSAFEALYHFTALDNGTNSDGTQPYGGLVLASDGTLYGTARYGGPSGSVRAFGPSPIGSGTIFGLKTNGAGFGVVHAFDTFSGDILAPTNNDGASPSSALILGTDGELYGTTPEAGGGGSGTIFSVETDGSNYSTLHAFNYAPPPRVGTPGYGLYPYGGLVQAADGMLYGAAYGGGLVSNGGGLFGGFFAGTVYRLSRDGSGLALLHSFASLDPYSNTNADGAKPFAALLRATDGRLDGVTSAGGANASGTVFSFVPPVVLQVTTSNHLVRLSWPISATNFVLETSGTLSFSAVWSGITNNISTVNDTFRVTLPATSAAAFFRLHQM